MKVRCIVLACAFAVAVHLVIPSGSSQIASEYAARSTTSPVLAGDVVFFRTNTWRSAFVRLLQSGDQGFAHVGIVVRGGEVIRVVHACPTGSATVRIDSLKDLLARKDVTSAVVYRSRATGADAMKAATIAEEYARRKTPFDFDFDLANDRAIYCTELIWLCYRAAGLKVKSGGVLFPADLLQSGFFRPLPRAAGPTRSVNAEPRLSRSPP